MGKSKNHKILVFPFLALQYFVVSIGLFLFGFWVFDRFFLLLLAVQGQISSRDWFLENEVISLNNYQKNLADGTRQNPSVGTWIWHSNGFPMSDFSEEDHRILVMGDSFVWGDSQANINDVWWRQLQRELTERGYSEVEVMGAGLNGASTRERLDQAREIVAIYEPDLIIWGYVVNDPDENRIEFTNNEFLIGFLDQLIKRDIIATLSIQLRSAHNLKRYHYWEDAILSPENLDVYAETIENLSNFQEENKIPGFLITLPNIASRERYAVNYSHVLPLFEENNVPVLNILDAYLDYFSDSSHNELSLGVNPANGHPGAASTHFYAVQAADFIETHYPEVLGSTSSPLQGSNIVLNDWMPYFLEPVELSSGSFAFEYPISDELMLRMPVKRPFVQLNFESPVRIDSIQLSGSSLQEATIDVTTIDENLGFDDGLVQTLATQRGHSLSWNLPASQVTELVNTIRISAHFSPGDRTLVLGVLSDDQ